MSEPVVFNIPTMHENIVVIVRTEEQTLNIMRFFSEREITEKRIIEYLNSDNPDLNWNEDNDKLFLLSGDLVSNDLDKLPKIKKAAAD